MESKALSYKGHSPPYCILERGRDDKKLHNNTTIKPHNPFEFTIQDLNASNSDSRFEKWE